jgi:uncharacterized coiled-coil DUF342 family protein
MGGLKSHTESLSTTLLESENRLATIRTQSEMVMKQMLLSSKKMDELEKQNSGLHNLYTTLKAVAKELEGVMQEYLHAESQLTNFLAAFEQSKERELKEIKEGVDQLSENLLEKIEISLERLEKHYHTAGDDVTKNVQFLAKRAQLQKGYTSEKEENPKS